MQRFRGLWNWSHWYQLYITKLNQNIPAYPCFFFSLIGFYLNQSSVTFHLSLPHPCVWFWSFLILSLIYYGVFSLKSYSCDMTKCASQRQFFFSFLYPLYSSLWWCQWALASAGRLSTLPSLSCESRLAGGLEDGWRCVRRAILLNKRGGVRTADRNTRIKLVSICPFSHHRSFHFPPLCAYELMLDQTSYPQTLNHILPQQKTKVALDQLERVGQRACRFLLLFPLYLAFSLCYHILLW